VVLEMVLLIHKNKKEMKRILFLQESGCVLFAHVYHFIYKIKHVHMHMHGRYID
jgi:hypothetical protein